MIGVKLAGMWLLSDSWFSILTYWGKEDWKQQHIRWIRLGVGVWLIIFG